MHQYHFDDPIRARFHGCLLAGAAGDALGAPVEFMSRSEILDRFGAGGINRFAPAYGRLGAITDDTQLALFTAEGLLLGWEQGCRTGQSCLVRATHEAYQRWLLTQEETPGPRAIEPGEAQEGWLLAHPELHSRRGPGTTCLAALAFPRGPGVGADNDRKGCGGVMRVAPVGLFMWRPGEAASLDATFRLGAALAGLTHGHPTGRLSAGVAAVLVQLLLHGRSLAAALAQARALLVRHAGHEETLEALTQAELLASSALPRPMAIAALGQGWVAEEALAIAVYCALAAESLEDGVVLAVNHDGDSDSTGAIAGQLLGAMHGAEAIPGEWLAQLELREAIADAAERLYRYWTVRMPG